MCLEGIYDRLPTLLDITYPADEVYYLLLDSHHKLVGLAFFLSVVNLHEVLGFDRSKQQHILYDNKLVGFHKMCSASCGHARDLEAFL